MSSSVLSVIREKLSAALSPVHLEILDESRSHAGHAGARRGGGHYAVTVVSEAFVGLALPARHRLVYQALSSEMSGAIHALAIAAATPAEWEASGRRAGSTTTPA
ncbi:MAG TPA: BolA family protein [Candidatus Polarisedimenticolia bacterium]|nr:BolA family protein [Candidatus Polarisedimenticolia bacterium]